ncbi:uncharacterized protein BO87DRAFT_397902 [Aspergillus neoniger CBS 115656]|uniref:Uncharacterized protein n=1 Tax=Aspergillus neoniger (strain CBS 115656) TaxID=1448310 RepID=A0A318YG41_ASPNB|nr:hypothetical protein BO87DRAFT_397902 [Aspergillus neoniger CBS 115656]PYH33366.1 hypothetical protein BO87DRAFT_397902 [Aspergillus neoniger CBS 115656]
MELRSYLYPPPRHVYPLYRKAGNQGTGFSVLLGRHTHAGGPVLELDEVACGLLGGYEIRFHKLEGLGLALKVDGGSPYYKRGRGDRSAIDSESLLGCAVVTPLLNVALCVCVCFLLISNVKAQPRMRNAAGYIKSIIHAVDFR